MSYTLKTYLKYISFTLSLILPFASFQFIYVYGIGADDFNLRLLIIPLIVSIVFGSLIANAVLLRYKLKQAQDDFVQQAKMASLGHLVKSVAHEVNTPVGNTITLISLLKEQRLTIEQEIQSGSPQKLPIEQALEDIKQNLTVMESSMQQVATLVRNFKTISADNRDELKRIDMYDYIESLLGAVQTELKKGNIESSMECEKEIFILTYPGLLLQILSQCIYNAVHHAFENISDPKISLSCFNEDQRVIIEVADNGNGIDKQLLPNIFDPFTMQSRKQGRVGLGLAMVYNIIKDNLHGDINVKSSQDGTLFKISLPEEVSP